MAINVTATEKAHFIVESCLLIDYFNRKDQIRDLLDLLRYDETASEKECIAVYRKAVKMIKESFREKDPDITFDDKNTTYTSIKKQLELITKDGRLQGDEQR